MDSSLQDEIRAFYHRAHECDPRDATALADYGRYILSEFKDVTNATLLLNKALALDPQSEVAMYSLALLNFRYVERLHKRLLFGQYFRLSLSLSYLEIKKIF